LAIDDLIIENYQKWKIVNYLEINSKRMEPLLQEKYHKAKIEYLTAKQLLGNEDDNYIFCNQIANNIEECNKLYNEWAMSDVWRYYLTQAAINFEPIEKKRR